MLYLIITAVIICLATISISQWIEGIPTLYRADYASCVGFYNHSIYLLGGFDNQQQLTEYLIPDNTFIDHGDSYFSPSNIKGLSQYWTQVDNILYFLNYVAETISIFDMQTNSFTSNYTIISNFTTTKLRACITSSSNHLFLLGGETPDTGTPTSNVDIYNLSNHKWQTDVPSMQIARSIFSCIFHAGSNKLYAIAGYQQKPSEIYFESIEKIEINDIIQNVNAWSYIEPLSVKLSDTRCVAYKNMIYIIGGYNKNGATNKVHVINALSDTVTLFADSIPMSLSNVAPIIVDHILYVFSGYSDNGVNTWMTYDLYMSTAAPSSVPTTHISTAYPITSSPPTEQPTDSTSVPTTDPITSDPTETYAATSFVPTNRPSLSPIKPASNPSLYAVLYPPSTKSTMFSYYSSTVFEGTDPEDRNNSFSKEVKHVDVITIVLSIIILSASIAIVKYLYSVLKLRKEASINRNHMKAQPNAPQHIVAKAQEVKTHERKHTISSSSMSNSEQLYDNNLRIELQTAGQTVEKEIECNTIETVGGGFEGRNSDQVEPEKAPKDMDENANITDVSSTTVGSSDFKHAINVQNVLKGSAVRTKGQK